MTRVATLEAVITANTGQFTSGLSAAQGKLSGFSGGLSSVVKGVTGFDVSTLGAAAAVGALAAGLKYAIGQAAESEAIMAQTEAVIKSTGSAAGMTADQISDMSASLSGMSTFADDAIQKGANLLLTFTNIGAEVFPMATAAMLDMATAMGTDAGSGAIQLGKALNDPIAGITALTRVGVSFTKEQKEMIQSMVEMGDVAGAQKIIIAELNKEFGGSAAAQLDTYAGKMAQLKNNFDNLAETVGNELLPPLAEAAAALNLLMTWDAKLDAVLVEHEGHVRETAASYEEYAAEMVRASHAAGEYGEANGRNLRTNRSVTDALGIMTEAQFNAARGLDGLTDSWKAAADGMARFRTGAKLVRQAMGEIEEGAGKAAVGMTNTSRAAGGMRDSFKFAYDAGMLLEMGLSGDLLDATEDYNTTMAETTLAIADYHTAMAEGGKAAEEAAGTLDGLIAQQGLAEDAFRKATAEIILQQVAMALGKDGALEFAHATGILSDADYELGKGIQRVTDAADLNNDGMITGVAEQKLMLEGTLRLTEATNNQALGIETATTNMTAMSEATTPLAGGLDLVATAADHVVSAVDFIQPEVAIDTTPAISSLDNATTSAYNFHRELDNIPRNVTVDVITNNHTNYSGYQIPGAGGHATGADFIVPPGFPHDSYPMNVQSGEHVVVTPAGGARTGSGSGTTINLIVNNFVAPVAGGALLQTARAVAGGL